MYIPMLAREVVEGNLRGDKPAINIKVRDSSCVQQQHKGSAIEGTRQVNPHAACLSLRPITRGSVALSARCLRR
jgi:hypothetical protein